MTFDAEAYAEGICNSAAGSTIETLLDTLKFVVEDMSDDAIQYRRYDSAGDLSQEGDDIDKADAYVETTQKLKDLIDAIKKREEEMDEEEDERYTVTMDVNTGNYVILDGGAPHEEDGNIQQFGNYDEANEECVRLNATD
jgi:hypothetical protein